MIYANLHEMSSLETGTEDTPASLQDPPQGSQSVESELQTDAAGSPASKAAKTPAKANRPRSNTCPTLHSPTQARKLKMGSRVVILGTENVEQRVPHLVGVEATIVDVPGIFYASKCIYILNSGVFYHL